MRALHGKRMFAALLAVLAFMSASVPPASGTESRWRLDLENGAASSADTTTSPSPATQAPAFLFREDFKTEAGYFLSDCG